MPLQFREDVWRMLPARHRRASQSLYGRGAHARPLQLVRLGRCDVPAESAVPAVQEEFDEASARNWSQAAKWHGLEIIATEKGGENDTTGVVEFRASYTAGKEFCNHHERATFVRDEDGWKFEDGSLVKEQPIVREEPKVGRNDPCPCGSGKKFKKCCGSKS